MKQTILVVEDNPVNTELVKDILFELGHSVVHSETGVDAMQLARTHQPALILMDIRLPRLSGIDVTKFIKAQDDLKHIPIIALTASAMKGDEEKILQGGCDDYIPKPIQVIEFINLISSYLDSEARGFRRLN
ncbi:MAG: response regulator [Rhodospirillaceae bacterium]|mgnify:FL=1|nr:response regulator [Rhodospirillaceae bacterium]